MYDFYKSVCSNNYNILKRRKPMARKLTRKILEGKIMNYSKCSENYYFLKSRKCN